MPATRMIMIKLAYKATHRHWMLWSEVGYVAIGIFIRNGPHLHPHEKSLAYFPTKLMSVENGIPIRLIFSS